MLLKLQLMLSLLLSSVMQFVSDFDFFGTFLYNWQVFPLGNSVVCKIYRKNVSCYYKGYFFWLKPHVLFPNLAPALINERPDGDSLDEERTGALQQTLICEWL